MKTFKNRHNTCIKQDGKEYWISRSVAVIGTIFMKNTKDNELYVLLSKRGEGTPDCKGYWNLACGYMDFDENGTDAVRREVWEETGLDLDEIVDKYQIAFGHEKIIKIYYDMIF